MSFDILVNFSSLLENLVDLQPLEISELHVSVLILIELMINKLHGLSPSGGLVSPSGGFASLFLTK